MASVRLFRVWAISTHIDKYLVDKYFRHSSVAVLLVFTSLIGVAMLPVIWWYQPHVLDLSGVSIAVIMASGARGGCAGNPRHAEHGHGSTVRTMEASSAS